MLVQKTQIEPLPPREGEAGPSSGATRRTPGPRYRDNGFDRHLGPSSARYFGSGYRRVRHSLGRLQIEDVAGEVRLGGSGAAHYPVDWSAGPRGAARSPHLSTIDAIVFSVAVVEAHLREIDGLTAAATSESWLSDIDIKAGALPWEDLGAIPLSCSRTAQLAVGAELESTFTLRIATMTVVLRVRHSRPSGRLGSVGAVAAVPLTAPLTGPMVDAYRHTAHSSALDDAAATAGRTLGARHVIRPRASLDVAGIGSTYWPGATVVDCLVIASQMAQVLVFASPGLGRESVSNLWMRRARFTATARPGRVVDSASTLEVVTSRSFDRGLEGTLHSVDVRCADLLGFAASASLAFVAPAAS